MNAYEGMFVIDLSEVKKDTNEVEEKIEGLIKKCGGELAAIARWDERKLAYEIKGRDTGLYTLTYFNGEQDTVRQLNHECRLSGYVMRALFLRIKEIPDIDEVISRKNDRAAREDRFDGGGHGPRRDARSGAQSDSRSDSRSDAREAPAKDAPVAASNEVPAEESAEKPAEEPTVPVEEPAKAPAEEPAEMPAEAPVEELTVSTEKPAEEPVEAPAEEPAEVSAEEPVAADASSEGEDEVEKPKTDE